MQQTSPFQQEARRRVSVGFFIHLAAFVLVNAGLAILNLVRNPERLWFVWVLAGWGIGLIGHGLLTYLPQTRERAVRRATERLEERNKIYVATFGKGAARTL